MAGPSLAWVRVPTPVGLQSSNSPQSVDLGGSLAVASNGLFSTGVSTDRNGKQPSKANT